MTDFLLELRSEEIPARMQDRARDDLASLFAAQLATAGIAAAAVETFAGPRRLALIARGLPDATAALHEEVKGPRASAPPQALDGFLRKTGLAREQLVERDGVLFAVTQRPGRATAAVLADAIPAIVRGFPWPKSMRWGAQSVRADALRWVRPLHGIVALFGDAVVACEIAGVASGRETPGHRFLHAGVVTIASAASYAEQLRAAHVLVDQDERRALIRTRAAALADAVGLTLVEDEGLVAENAGLTEWPVPLLGRFDPAFLSVPPEVIQLTARVNQKYFVCRDAEGRLADAFVCTANIAASDGGAMIVEGNRKVLAARLADARFFYDTDRKVPLEQQAAKLSHIVFHEKLGTVADKVDRVAGLARWLVEDGIVGGATHSTAVTDHPGVRKGGAETQRLADKAERAARLAKADLVTGMVGEFPELQGVMGGYYAAAQGEDPEVAAAIRDHHRPAGQGDEVPTALVTVAVALADKLDTLVGFFGAGLPPTGSKDPFALRRAALGCIDIITMNGLRLPLASFYAHSLHDHVSRFVGAAMARAANQDITALMRSGVSAHRVISPEYQSKFLARPEVKSFVDGFASAGDSFLNFFADRLKVQQREAGVRHDLIDAVFAAKKPRGGGEDDLVRLLARVRALQAFVGTADGANLLAGYKRAANILKKEGWADAGDAPAAPPPAHDPDPAEADLVAALDAAEPTARRAVADEAFEAAMAALATLRAPIDAFFEQVTVNDPDPGKRAARLALLARIRAAVHAVADFSRIEG